MTELIEQTKQQINTIETNGQMLKEKAENLFESQLKKTIQKNHLLENQRQLEDMKELLAQVEKTNNQRKACQDEFDEAIPSMILELRSKKDGATTNDVEKSAESQKISQLSDE